MTSSESTRLNKHISDSGFCSRRQADRLIEEGKVAINGQKAGLGDRVFPGDTVTVNGESLPEMAADVYILLNKPVGITCTTNKRFSDNVVDFVDYPERIYPVGRLDKPSEGLLLMTNDGAIVNKILRAANEHEKEYVVKVNRPITDDFIDRMGNGVPILNTITKRCEVERLDDFTFRIVLVQGLNRQIRRMCEYLGYRVVSLKRIRLINLKLGNLPVGKWRELSEEEVKALKQAVKDSQEHPAYLQIKRNQQQNKSGKGPRLHSRKSHKDRRK